MNRRILATQPREAAAHREHKNLTHNFVLFYKKKNGWCFIYIHNGLNQLISILGFVVWENTVYIKH